MANRTPHGDDWIEVLGDVLVGLVSLTWSLLVLSFRFVQWIVQKVRGS
jgi:hypothetical protein